MRKITVDAVFRINATLFSPGFRKMNPSSKALFLSLLLLERPNNVFAENELKAATLDLGYSKETLNTLFKNRFFTQTEDGTVVLDEYNGRDMEVF